MSDEGPKRPNVPADIGIGCVWHLLIALGTYALLALVTMSSAAWLPAAVGWLYGVGVIVLASLQFSRHRPYIALGILMLPVLLALAVGGCLLMYQPSW